MPDKVFKNAFEYKVIYIFTIEDTAHRNLVKIGDATLHTETAIDQLTPNCRELNQASLKRIKEYTNTAGLTPKLLWSEVATRTIRLKDGTYKLEAFRDHQVHAVLKNSGITPKKLGQSREWFEIDIETSKKAIDAVKSNYANLSNSGVVKQTPIIFRPEQVACIEKVVKHFKKANRFLINAKMRYGKTFVSLEIIKKCEFQKTIIMTHRPVVDEGWYEDFTKLFYGTDYIYGSKSKGYTVDELLAMNKPFIYFASVQDLRGSSAVGGKFDKNHTVFNTIWDCCVVDEAHEGTTTALGEDTVKAVFKEGSGTKLLALSGTPFNILQDYDENSIYTWDYIMEQECKSEWDLLHFGDSNPYDELPELRIYTYSLENVLRNSNYITFEDKAFNFKEFFRTFTGDFSVDYSDMPAGAEIGDFVHESDVWSFLNLMTKQDDNSYYPYSNEEYRALFKHSLWMVPGVKEARALKKLMLKHPIFGCGQFNIVNVAGNGDEEEASEEALSKVRNAIKNAGDDYTITLSCGRLTTGVTVKEWTAVFMLAGSYSTSAANYLQTIFRVQSPCNENGRIKENAYVFDFAPDRTLKMISSAVSVSSKAGKTKISDKQIMGKFLNYCPVIGISGSEMQEFSATRLLQQLKKAYADKVVRNGFDDTSLYNDELFKLQAIDIDKFDELKGIIGASKAQAKQKDITVNSQGLTDEEYEESEKLDKKKKGKQPLTEEEKARLEELKRLKKVRSDAISILRGISIRMPLLIYGADIPYDEEITLDRFVDVVDDSSWDEFMPTGVTKEKFKEFQKYYDEEVFIAAGRRIRNIARDADTLDPTERVIKIASLFSYFKNPDKETVLTPWRVVNMHMSDTLGGWDFWDEQHQDTLDSPRFVDRGDVTAKTFSNKDAKILEINSKTGLYPLYVAYSCYRSKLSALDNGTITVADKQALWLKAVEENIFVICKTPMAKAITKRTLLGYTKSKVNAHCFDDLINTMQNKPEQFRKRVLRGKLWGKEGIEMKFDAIVGNPPYMAFLGGMSSQPIYQYFMNQAISMEPDYISMITPARWMTATSGTITKYRDTLLPDKRMVKLFDFQDASSCFSNVEIKGGVCYYLWDKSHYGDCYILSDDGMGNQYETTRPLLEQGLETFIRDGNIISIFEKVKTFNERSFSELVSSNDPFGFDIRENHSSKRIKPNYSLSEFEGSIPFYYNGWRKEGIGYVKKDNIRKGIELIDSYKIFIPKAWGVGNVGKDWLNPFLPEDNAVCTETYLSVGPFATKEEANNAISFIQTKFFHLMVSIIKSTQNTMQKAYALVPLQDFSEPWTDSKLYAKYGLSEKEIAYIEANVRNI